MQRKRVQAILDAFDQYLIARGEYRKGRFKPS
jgi:hypothetical protein